MHEYNLNELNEKYDLEFERVLNEIKKSNAKIVLLQFPDGLKPYATSIVDRLEQETNNKVKFMIWLGTCFGACDVPNLPKETNIDLVVQFGHASWK